MEKGRRCEDRYDNENDLTDRRIERDNFRISRGFR